MPVYSNVRKPVEPLLERSRLKPRQKRKDGRKHRKVQRLVRLVEGFGRGVRQDIRPEMDAATYSQHDRAWQLARR